MSRHQDEAEIVPAIPADARAVDEPGRERHLMPIENICHPGTYTYLGGVGAQDFQVWDGIDHCRRDAILYIAPDGELPNFRDGTRARWCHCNYCGQARPCALVKVGQFFKHTVWTCVECCPREDLPR